jgi:hypothetical protein
MCYSLISPDRMITRSHLRHAAVDKLPAILDNILIGLSSKVHETSIRDETVYNYITMHMYS